MPLALAFIALLLLVAAFRNTYQQLFTQLGSDLPGFAVWLGAIVAIGLIGFIPKMEPVSRALLALVFVVLVLKNRGAFQNFTQAFSRAPPTVPVPAAAQAPLGSLPIVFSNSSSGSAQGAAVSAASNFINPTGGLT